LSTLSNAIVSEERLTVVVGNSQELKLFGVPSYKPGTDRKCGEIIADLTCGLLTSWNCADNIMNMTFDTTAANTGSVTATCVSIQLELVRQSTSLVRLSAPCWRSHLDSRVSRSSRSSD
jgi:hypothetical protein